MGVGTRLKTELKSRGLVIKFVAKKTSIPYGSLVRYLDDSRPIPEDRLKLICLTFKINPKIFGLDDHNSCQQKEVANG